MGPDGPKPEFMRHGILFSAGLWVLSVILTVVCVVFQDKTGPTYPLEGRWPANGGSLRYKFQRSESIGTDLALVFPDPVPADVSGYVRYRRYKSDDPWATLPLKTGEFALERRGRQEQLKGLGAALPSLQERAGKYEFQVFVGQGGKKPESVTGDAPILARYKAGVPAWALVLHILAIFGSMTLAIRTVLEAIVNGDFRWMLWTTTGTLVLGAFVFGPIVQWYAFGVWWSGVPFGFDWTDNKVLVELIAWLPALFLNLGKRRNRSSVYLAGVVTLAVYFIPHSIFGSEYDYRAGGGRGTAG
jgi:hypothetical protein